MHLVSFLSFWRLWKQLLLVGIVLNPAIRVIPSFIVPETRFRLSENIFLLLRLSVVKTSQPVRSERIVDQLELLRSRGTRTAHKLKENSVVHRLVFPEMHGGGCVFLEFDFQQVLEIAVGNQRFGYRNPPLPIE